eukprot:scaffold545_cov372-Pavlova_lutheri.AAC.22
MFRASVVLRRRLFKIKGEYGWQERKILRWRVSRPHLYALDGLVYNYDPPTVGKGSFSTPVLSRAGFFSIMLFFPSIFRYAKSHCIVVCCVGSTFDWSVIQPSFLRLGHLLQFASSLLIHIVISCPCLQASTASIAPHVSPLQPPEGPLSILSTLPQSLTPPIPPSVPLSPNPSLSPSPPIPLSVPPTLVSHPCTPPPFEVNVPSEPPPSPYVPPASMCLRLVNLRGGGVGVAPTWHRHSDVLARRIRTSLARHWSFDAAFVQAEDGAEARTEPPASFHVGRRRGGRTGCGPGGGEGRAEGVGGALRASAAASARRFGCREGEPGPCQAQDV